MKRLQYDKLLKTFHHHFGGETFWDETTWDETTWRWNVCQQAEREKVEIKMESMSFNNDCLVSEGEHKMRFTVHINRNFYRG